MIFILYAIIRNFAVKRLHNLIGSLFRSIFLLCPLRLLLLSLDESESSLNDGSDEPSFLSFRRFFSCRVSVSLVTSLTMMGLGPGHLVRALFHFALSIRLVMSVA